MGFPSSMGGLRSQCRGRKEEAENEAAEALVAAGASITARSGVDGDGATAEELAKQLRSYDVIFLFRDHLAAAAGGV